MAKLLTGNTFTSRKFFGLLLTSGLSTAIVYINQIIDNVITANTLGTVALSATNICAPLMTAAGFLGILLGSGTTESVGNWFWVGERDKAARLFSYGVIMSILAGILFTVITFFLKQPLLRVFGVTDNIYAYADAYYSVIIFAGLIQPIYAFITGIVFISGDSRLSGLSSVLQLGVNIVVSLLLCPVMGTAGAAIGTICGVGTGLIVLCFHFVNKKNRIKFTFKIKAKYIKKSINFTLIWTMPALYTIIISIWLNNHIVNTVGDQFLPLSAVVSAMLGLTSFFEAVSTADNPLIGTYSAENNVDRCKSIMRSAALLSVIIGGFILFISFVFPQNMLTWFGIEKVEYLTEPGILIIQYMAVGLAISAVGTIFTDYYFYLQFHVASLIIQALMQFVFPLLFVIILADLWGIQGMLIGYIIGCALPYAVGIVILFAKYGKEMFPYMMKPDADSVIENFDVIATSEGVMRMRDEVEQFLLKRNIPSRTRNKVIMMIEETGMLIIEKNPNKKVYMESMVKITDRDILMILRDNGIIFDITDVDMSITSFRVFVLSRMMDFQEEKRYFHALNYNRNGFRFELKEG